VCGVSAAQHLSHILRTGNVRDNARGSNTLIRNTGVLELLGCLVLLIHRWVLLVLHTSAGHSSCVGAGSGAHVVFTRHFFFWWQVVNLDV
jgi:hypothetical protein